ncbi:hypothetical protein BG004_003843 [Podila humilis]|nr:hypothetical protein BG004_003843 [Podila humilis]
MSRKLGILVAIPIKGRKLVNRSGGKQSPFIQLKLGEDKKRTKASLIASVRFDVFQNHLDMHVMVIDEGKKNEIIGDGTLLLHEVIDKGELDVWFPIKYKGKPAGDIYFELTFYAAAPLVVGGGSPMPPQVQMHPQIRHTQPGFRPSGLQHVPYGPPTPYPGNIYHSPRPYTVPQQQQPYPVPVNAAPFRPTPQPQGPPRPSGPPGGPGFNPGFVSAPPQFRPSTQYTSPQMPHTRPGAPPRPIPGANGVPGYNHPMPQPLNSGNSYPPANMPMHNNGMLPMSMPVPHPHGGGNSRPHTPAPNSFPSNAPNYRPQNNNHMRPPLPSGGSGPATPVTPLMQYNYSLGSFP